MGDQKMWNSQDGSLSFNEKYDLMTTYPKDNENGYY